MMHLFVSYLGGSAPGCRIELHDVAFSVGETIEDCYDHIKQQWFGNSRGLHIDAYTALTYADQHTILIQRKDTIDPGEQQQKHLYFVNLGGYQRHLFTEVHKTGFYIADTPDEAKKRAKQELGHALDTLHTDNLLDIDDCINISEALPDYTLTFQPTVSATPPTIEFTCGYHLLP